MSRMKGDPQTVQRVLKQVRFFRALPAPVIEALGEAAVRLEAPAGEVIFLEGDPVAGLYVVESGTVKISRMSLEGREHILLLCSGIDTFNDVAVTDGGPNPATATAFTDVAMWHISRTDLQRIARRYPDLAWTLAEDMARRARYLVGLVEDLATRSVRGRLAKLLLDQAQASTTDTMPRLLTQEEIAAHLGTVREMVGRTLRSLAADGIIEFDRHRIVVLEPERLRQEAQV